MPEFPSTKGDSGDTAVSRAASAPVVSVAPEQAWRALERALTSNSLSALQALQALRAALAERADAAALDAIAHSVDSLDYPAALRRLRELLADAGLTEPSP